MVFQIKAMDNEQDDIQFLGFFGILKESLEIILTWSKIFFQITLAFILPHSCLYLANNWVSKLLYSKIVHHTSFLPNNLVDSPTYNHISNLISSEWGTLWLIKAIYFILTIILSLFTISAVVYTVACIYTSKSINFRKIISVVPKVWKRLMITFLCNFCILIVYMCVLSLAIFVVGFILVIFFNKPENEQFGMLIVMPIIMGIIFIIFMVGFFYMAIIWQLANVISVMEKDCCGFKALKKSKELIKGKMGIAFAIFLVINLCGLSISTLIQKLGEVGIVGKISFGIPSVMLWTLLTLFGLVVHTIFYLVCKSYHHESIDRSLLADHLDEYLLGEYVPLKTKDIQLEGLHV